MRSVLTYIWGGIVAILTCTVVASFFSTQRVIGSLNKAGASVGFGERLSMTIYDVSHFGTLYGVFILLAFLIALSAGGILFQRTRYGRGIIYVVAGSVAMFVMLWAMKQVFFGVPIVPGARDIFGLLLQMAAGGLGGFIFHRMTQTRARF